MNSREIGETQKKTSAESLTSSSVLQRKCDCGQHTVAGGECTECRKERLKVQRWAKNQAEPSAMLRSLDQSIHPTSGTFIESLFGHDFSQVPVHTNVKGSGHTLPTGERRSAKPSFYTQPIIQRFPKNGGADLAPGDANPAAEAVPTPASVEPATEPASPATEPEAPVETPIPGLLVEDSAEEVAPGQMRKTEFLTELRAAVCSTAEAVLASTGQTTEGCPYLDYWFDYYSQKDSQHIERAIHRYAPETAGVTTARGYIPIITARVRRSVETWAQTGEITGVPEGVPATLPGTTPAEGGEGAGTPTGPVMFKAREGGAKVVDDPQAIQEQLGEGRPLDSSVRSHMESAFGLNLSHVRVHTDSSAAGLSNNLNARAFTVGKHVAFGSGEYQPGTLIGDALIAHELAHVVQQGGGSASLSPMEQGSTGYNALEEDADLSAVGAVASLWGGAKGKLKDIAQNAMPRLRSGLRLSRCPDTSTKTTSLPKKTVTTNITKLHDSTGSADSALTYANTKVYNQANIEVKKGKEVTFDEPKSKGILGDDLILEEYTDPTKPTDEEKVLFKENQTAGAVTVYYVKGSSAGTLGEALWPATGTGLVGVVVTNVGTDNTFSHELGHVLLDDGGHNPDPDYLMHATAPDPTKLTPDEIKKMRASPYAK